MDIAKDNQEQKAVLEILVEQLLLLTFILDNLSKIANPKKSALLESS